MSNPFIPPDVIHCDGCDQRYPRDELHYVPPEAVGAEGWLCFGCMGPQPGESSQDIEDDRADMANDAAREERP